MQDQLRELQETLFLDIPITKHLGVLVEKYDGRGVILSAPLRSNVNHKETAFAGSLNALVTLAGWSMLWLMLKELEIDGEIVIQDGAISYLLPVTRDFSARCGKPDLEQVERFEQMLRKRGKARLELCAEIWEDDEMAVSFKGRYVVHL